MAKNFEITLKMLEDNSACGEAIYKFKDNFGEKLILNAPNARKAAKVFKSGEEWLCKLLKSNKNKDAYTNFFIESYKQWEDECIVDDHDINNDLIKCNERGVQHRIRCYDKFIELYRADNKAPRKRKVKEL